MAQKGTHTYHADSGTLFFMELFDGIIELVFVDLVVLTRMLLPWGLLKGGNSVYCIQRRN
jgi:hypothetical protein